MSRSVLIITNDRRNLQNFRGHVIRKLQRDGVNVQTCCIGENSQYEFKLRFPHQLFIHVLFNFLLCFKCLNTNRDHVVLVYSFPLCVFCAFANVFVGHTNLHLFISGRGRLFNKFKFLNRLSFVFSLLPRMSKNLYVLNNLDYKFFSTKVKKPVKFFGEGLDCNEDDVNFSSTRTYALGYVGRIERIKGICSLNKLPNSYPLVIFGDGPDRDLIVESDNISFHGYVDEKSDIYNRFDILVFPSLLYEGLPMVIVEAMYFGKPVVWNIKNRSLDNDVLTKVNSIGVDFSNDQEVSEAIKQINRNYDLFSLNARKTISSDFYSDNVYARYRKFILE